MTTIKTAISLKESLFRQVADVAEEMQVPRSRLFVVAMEEFLERRRNRRLLEAINAAYATEADEEQQLVAAGMRRKQRALVEGEW